MIKMKQQLRVLERLGRNRRERTKRLKRMLERTKDFYERERGSDFGNIEEDWKDEAPDGVEGDPNNANSEEV